MQRLQELIDIISEGRRLHVSILDVSGVLNTHLTEINLKNITHSVAFCDIAKSTDRGHRRCLRCKAMANFKAMKSKTPFSGHCFWGLWESAYPVVIDGSTAAIVYVGNAVVDKGSTERLIRQACRSVDADPTPLIEESKNCETLSDPKRTEVIAELVGDYVKLLYSKAPVETAREHWLVSSLKLRAQNACSEELSLRELAISYSKNEKYMGRLFKDQVGVSFREYCNRIRLERAAELLRSTDKRVIDVALECGFNNVSYFNRCFIKAYGVPPGEYRKE